MHVPDPGVGAAERRVQAGVVEAALEDLVESDRHVERRGLRGLVLRAEVAEQRPRRHRHVPHAALDEVARGRGLRERD